MKTNKTDGRSWGVSCCLVSSLIDCPPVLYKGDIQCLIVQHVRRQR